VPEKHWKLYERRIMSLLGGRRIPVTGRSGPGGDPGDGELAGYYIEIRDRARPRPLRWFREVAAGAAEEGSVPLLIFKGPSPRLSPLVILRLRDLEVILRGTRPGSGPGPGAGGENAGAPAPGGDGAGTRPGLRRVPSAPASGDPVR